RRPGDALAPLESAMAALATRPAANADERLSAGRAHFALAEALAALGRDPERALALARSARGELRAAGNADHLGGVEAWLRRRQAGLCSPQGVTRGDLDEPTGAEATAESGPAGTPVRGFRLTLVEGAGLRRPWTSTGARSSLGSHPSNDLVLRDPTVSR